LLRDIVDTGGTSFSLHHYGFELLFSACLRLMSFPLPSNSPSK